MKRLGIGGALRFEVLSTSALRLQGLVICSKTEATAGIEPAMKVLQTSRKFLDRA
jgi:hypothetical protein